MEGTSCKLCSFDAEGSEDANSLIWTHVGTIHEKVNQILQDKELDPVPDPSPVILGQTVVSVLAEATPPDKQTANSEQAEGTSEAVSPPNSDGGETPCDNSNNAHAASGNDNCFPAEGDTQQQAIQELATETVPGPEQISKDDTSCSELFETPVRRSSRLRTPVKAEQIQVE